LQIEYLAKKIADRFARAQRHTPAPLMLRSVMQHMTPLAESREVGIRIVGRIVIAMRGRQHHSGHLHQSGGHVLGNGKGTAHEPAPAVPGPGERMVENVR